MNFINVVPLTYNCDIKICQLKIKIKCQKIQIQITKHLQIRSLNLLIWHSWMLHLASSHLPPQRTINLDFQVINSLELLEVDQSVPQER